MWLQDANHEGTYIFRQHIRLCKVTKCADRVVVRKFLTVLAPWLCNQLFQIGYWAAF